LVLNTKHSPFVLVEINFFFSIEMFDKVIAMCANNNNMAMIIIIMMMMMMIMVTIMRIMHLSLNYFVGVENKQYYDDDDGDGDGDVYDDM
jgi:nitrogen fixation-related uncharacterized protein